MNAILAASNRIDTLTKAQSSVEELFVDPSPEQVEKNPSGHISDMTILVPNTLATTELKAPKGNPLDTTGPTLHMLPLSISTDPIRPKPNGVKSFLAEPDPVADGSGQLRLPLHWT